MLTPPLLQVTQVQDIGALDMLIRGRNHFKCQVLVAMCHLEHFPTSIHTFTLRIGHQLYFINNNQSSPDVFISELNVKKVK